jgi:hypothetical protein
VTFFVLFCFVFKNKSSGSARDIPGEKVSKTNEEEEGEEGDEEEKEEEERVK